MSSSSAGSSMPKRLGTRRSTVRGSDRASQMVADRLTRTHVDYFYLRRFLRARTYDLERATVMWLNHVAWLKEFQVNTILQDFYFAERDEFVSAYPQARCMPQCVRHACD